MFPHPAPGGSPRPEPRSLPRHFDRSPGPRPGRSGETRSAFRRRQKLRRLAGLRRRSGFSPSSSLRAGCFASVEMTGGVLRSGRSGRQGAGRGGHTSGVGKSSYRERNWQCQGLLSEKRKDFLTAPENPCGPAAWRLRAGALRLRPGRLEHVGFAAPTPPVAGACRRGRCRRPRPASSWRRGGRARPALG